MMPAACIHYLADIVEVKLRKFVIEAVTYNQLAAFYYKIPYTPPRTARISGTKTLTLEITILGWKMMVISGLEFFILKLNEPL